MVEKEGKGKILRTELNAKPTPKSALSEPHTGWALGPPELIFRPTNLSQFQMTSGRVGKI